MRNLYFTIFLSSLFFLLGTITSFGQIQTRVVSVSNFSDIRCIGTSSLFLVELNPSDLADADGMGDPSGIELVDNNPGDMVNGAVGTLFNNIVVLIQVNGGTVGSTVTFDLILEDPDGFQLPLPPGTNLVSFNPPIISYQFSIKIDGKPSAAILPADPVVCNGAPTTLTAVSTNGSTVTNYVWSANNGDGSFQGDVNPGNTPVATVTDGDTYEVLLSNNCPNSQDFEATTVEENKTPVIDLTCTDNGNNTTTLTIDILNDATDVTVQVFNDGNPYSDFPNLDGPISVMELIDNNDFFDQDFTVNAENYCGTSSNTEACPIMTPLPVELQYFQANRKTEGVWLEWSTLTETNNEFFSIERSYDGITFDLIADIPGAGTTQLPQQYAYLDRGAGEKSGGQTVLYYRLKQTDFDGTFTYSKMVTVTLSSKSILAINRIWQETNTLVADLNLPSDTQLDARIFNLNGRLLKNRQMDLSEGNAQLHFNLGELPPGIYLFSINDGQQLITQKFLKR